LSQAIAPGNPAALASFDRASFDRDERGRARLGGNVLEDLFAPDGLATPAYVYDLAGIRKAARSLVTAFGDAPHLVAYAVKANTSGPVVRTICEAGCGADVVSGGELAVALAVGIPPARVVMSGVAKSNAEIDAAIGAGSQGIAAIQLESVEEAGRVAARARALGRKARVGLRINPGVLVDTHANIATGHDEAKFGIPLADLGAAFEAIDGAPELALASVSSHVGSQLMDTSGYVLAAERVCDVVAAREARGPRIEMIDFGGGFGIDYGGTAPVAPAAFAQAALALAKRRGFEGRTLVVEPGRALVAAMGVLVARVVQTKRARLGADRTDERRWLFVDAGMNDLMRPALYQARHRIEPLDAPVPEGARGYRVVGPVCESSDDFGEHPMPDAPPAFVAIRDAGAYGYTMASEYNGRALPIEVFLDGDAPPLVKRSRSVDAWVADRLAES
jgi:diaminopimelate decarboxylase